MNSGIVEISGNIIKSNGFKHFTVIGDPGCDGLGAATMSILAKALNAGPADFAIIAGDLVPFGSRAFYDNVSELINTVASSPIYTLCGNHDTEFFTQYFGSKNYAIADRNTLIIILDNSQRRFTVEALDFCRDSLAKCKQENVIVMFHIPPPNRIVENSISAEAWEEFRIVYMPHLDRIKFFICGHVHSFFQDTIDNIPLVVTGGGGARIEPLKGQANNISYHVLKFTIGANHQWSYSYSPLDNTSYVRELVDPVLTKNLDEAFKNECIAHFRYHLYSEEADAASRPDLARLFRALSKSEYFHAKNHYYVMGQQLPMLRNIVDSVGRENFEVSTMYKNYMEQAIAEHHGLAKYTFYDALEAEKVHLKLLKEVSHNEITDASKHYYTCSSCGYTFQSDSNTAPKKCPICGAPEDKIILTE